VVSSPVIATIVSIVAALVSVVTLVAAIGMLLLSNWKTHQRAKIAEARARELEALLAKRTLEDRTVPTVRRVTGPL
jgi:ABC-type nickel/cobalt efflux system permease component RcnA